VPSLAAPVCRSLLAIAHEGSAVAAVSCWRHSSHHGDPAFCTDHTRPVLGTAHSKGARAPSRPTEQGQNRQRGFAAAPFLPKDLAGALKRLDSAEIDALLAAVTTEAERRGRRAKDKPTADARPPQPRQASAEHGAGSLTTGKLNAVRAAFKAGVKPLAIARQFGISQSEVRKAIATEDRDRKSSR
jgi:hypothetical protein